MNYYNEIDPFAARWLRNLVEAGQIAPGVVDERDIRDVQPAELMEYTQCHFFAGIGVWSYALRLVGWPDDKPVWTGSCPCQPFSTAGKGKGFADERHLWPAWFHLVSQCRPSALFGEQVASKDAGTWIDLVQADLEGLGYAFGAVAFPSAGIGAPHVRDRTYWLANSGRPGSSKQWRGRIESTRLATHSVSDGLGHAYEQGCKERERERGILGGTRGTVKGQATIGTSFHLSGLADSGLQQRQEGATGDDVPPGRGEEPTGGAGFCRDLRAGPTNGSWQDADWLGCRDGKWRPVEPCTFPLANGATARVGRLRAYGNAINAQAAAEFIKASQ